MGKEVDFPTLDADQWQDLFLLAKKQAVLGVVFQGVEKLPDEKWPPKKLSMWLYAQSGFIRKRNEEADAAALLVSRDLASAGYPTVLLKGQGISRLYSDPSLRQPGDVDVWSTAPRRSLFLYARARKPGSKVCYHHVDLPSVGKTGVELHFVPSWMNCPFTNSRLQRFFLANWQDSNVLALPGGEVKVPSMAFNRVFILVHIYRHLFSEGVGLRQLMDYYCVLDKGFTPQEKEDTVAVLKSLGLIRFASAVMWVLGKAFRMEESHMLVEPDPKAGASLFEQVILGGNFGKYDSSFKHSGWGKVRRSFRFVADYPSEVLWAPAFKLWQILFIRMKYNKVKNI